MIKIARKLTQFTKKEIDTLFNKAHRVLSQDGLTILIGPRQKDFGRILIMASKKIGSAPIRNKLRRQLKSIFYEHKFYQKEWDWIILPKPIVVQNSFQQLSELMIRALKNAS